MAALIRGDALARNATSSSGLTCDQIRAQRKSQKDELTSTISELESQVELQMEAAPALFKFENKQDLSRLDFVNIEIRESSFLNDLKVNLPNFEELSAQVSESIASGVSPGTALLRLEQGSTQSLKNFLSASKNNEQLGIKARQAISSHLSSIDEGLLSICENEGEFLHHFPQIFTDVLKASIQNLGSDNLASQEIIDTQAGLCSLYRRAPPGEQSSSLKYWLGLGAVGVGSVVGVVTSFTGIGAVLGGGIVVGGGALMAEDAFSRAAEVRVQSTNNLSLSRTSWVSVRDALDSYEDSIDARNGAILETAMVVPDALGFGLATRAILRVPQGGLRVARSTAMLRHSQELRGIEDPVDSLLFHLDAVDAEGSRLEELARNIPLGRTRRVSDASKVREILGSSVSSLEEASNARLLFETAGNLRSEMERLGKDIVADIRGTNRSNLDPQTVYSVLKRDKESAFISGVREKVGRKGYEKIDQMGDMVRGRFNLESRLEVENVVETIVRRARSQGLEVDEVVSPRGPINLTDASGNLTQGFSYDRYHVVLRDPQTGMLHEWQIGTAKVTEIYESTRPGIPVDNRELSTWMKASGINQDIHDINYDVFNEIIGKSRHHPDPQVRADMAKVVETYRLNHLNDRVSRLVAEAGAHGQQMTESSEKLRDIHTDLGEAFNGIVNEKGVDFVKSFFHILGGD